MNALAIWPRSHMKPSLWDIKEFTSKRKFRWAKDLATITYETHMQQCCSVDCSHQSSHGKTETPVPQKGAFGSLSSVQISSHSTLHRDIHHQPTYPCRTRQKRQRA